MNELELYGEKTFDDIKHIDECGNEYWFARELMKVLEYKKWERFNNVIETAKISCNQSNYFVSDHFLEFGKMVGC